MSHDWPARVRRLEEEVAGLRRAMRARSLIEQAKGMLAERLGCDPEAAFQVLSAQSQQTNTPLTNVAADIVGRPLPAPATEPAAAHSEAPGPIRLADPMSTPLLEAVTDHSAGHGSLPRDVARSLRLTMSALDVANDLDELVRTLTSVGSPGEDLAAAIFVAEVD